MVTRVTMVAGMAGAFAAGLFAGRAPAVIARAADQPVRMQDGPTATPAAGRHVYEIRIYTAGEGKMDAVVKRFRDPEVRLFEKSGMPAVLYSTAFEPAERQNQFVYLLRHDSREAARASWQKFLADQEFRAAAQASDEGGKAVVKVENMFVTPTDFSPLK
jgi:hypothetical protein